MAKQPTQEDIIKALENARAQSSVETNTSSIDASNRALFFRTPFIMSTVKRLSEEKKTKIVFRCNPEDVTYDFPQRGGIQDIKNGKVFYYWRNRARSSHFDLPAFTYTFQTGNIRVMIDSVNDIYLPEGLSNFYEWMSIYDEEKIIMSGDNIGEPNFVTLNHHSTIFPSLELKGFFEPSSLSSITEKTSESPLFTWQAKFLVYESTPSFNSQQFKNAFGSMFIQAHRNFK